MAEHDQSFEDFTTWLNKASSWLTRRNMEAICFDSLGRHCTCGADFMRARDENTFPVRWLWPNEVGQVVLERNAWKSIANKYRGQLDQLAKATNSLCRVVADKFGLSIDELTGG